MRSWHVVQRGPIGLALGFLFGPALDTKLPAALPGWSIVTCVDGSPPITQAELASARASVGASKGTPTGLMGWSAGCQPVRTILETNMLGGDPAFVACFDGTHAGLPPKPGQIEVWAEVMKAARAGRYPAIFTCTSMGYVEKLPANQAYMSAQYVLERAAGFEAL